MKIGHAKDFWGGIMFALIGAMFALIAYGVKFGDTVLLAGYSMGTPARMGPAFFPFWLGVILFVLGVAIAAMGFRHEGNAEDTRFPTFHWRPILFILGAVVMFGIILKAVGMLLAGYLLVIVAGFGDPNFKPKGTIILAFFLVIFCALVFVWGLKLPIPLCPDVESLQNAVKLCRS
jgi:putative tricarboxylic transport membrane protein